MNRSLVSLCVSAAAMVAVAIGHSPDNGSEYTIDFGLERSARSVGTMLVAYGGNPYLSLEPGAFRRFEGHVESEWVEIEVTALPTTRMIRFDVNGVRVAAMARAIEDREWIDGELAEVTISYFARCPETNSIYCLGQDVDIYEDGEVVSHDGTWLAGVNKALPGLAMPGLFLLGARYYQEFAPDIALDRAENVDMGFAFATPAGAFENCVAVLETDALDPDEEVIKTYAPGIGLIADGDLVLVARSP